MRCGAAAEPLLQGRLCRGRRAREGAGEGGRRWVRARARAQPRSWRLGRSGRNNAAVRPPACPGGRQTIAILCESRSRSTRHLGILTCIFSKQSHAHACNNSSLLFLPPGRTSTRPWHLACIGLVDFRTTFAALHPAPTQFPIFLICLCTCMCMRMHAAHAHAWTVSNYLLVSLILSYCITSAFLG